MARTYRRDSNGRFASGGGGSARPKARSAPRGTNRLTRDNAGRITSVGGQGATARGGRLRTAGGRLRATQTARIGGKRAGVIGKPKGLKAGTVKVGAMAASRTVYRSKSKAAARQRLQSNQLGKATAAKRGFNQAAAKRASFAESAPRIVVGRPKIAQKNIWGRTERVGSGRLRNVGERMGDGRILRPRAKRGPIPGSRTYKKQLQRLISGNAGKDVAAFRF
jgi:hypothetical protein